MAALVLVSTVAIHAVIATTFYLNRPEPRPGRGRPGQLVSTVKLIAAVSAGEREHVIADVAQTFPAIGIEALPGAPAVTGPTDETSHTRFLHARLGDAFTIVPAPAANDANRIAIELPDHSWIAARLPGERRRPSFFGGPWMTALLFVVGSVSLLSLWAARALTRPLSAFATAAESFSLTGAPEPLPERGPREIRLVARALNRMRSRIVDLIDDRTKMLAAISHDLRTPITRLQAAVRVHRRRRSPHTDLARSRPDACDAGGGAVVPQERPQRRAFHADRSVRRAATRSATSSATPAAMFATKARNT